MADKKKRLTMTTPRGRAMYPRLNSPDTKFNPDGDYKVTMAFATKDVEDLIQQLDELAAKAVEEAKKDPKNKGKKIREADLPYKINPENDDETLITFKMKAKVKGKDGKEYNLRPGLFDAKGKPFPLDKIIGGGSVLRVSFEPSGFFTSLVGAGVSLRLKAVQVIELQEYTGGGSAESYGFEEEDGYEAEESEPSENMGYDRTEEKKDDASPEADGSDF